MIWSVTWTRSNKHWILLWCCLFFVNKLNNWTYLKSFFLSQAKNSVLILRISWSLNRSALNLQIYALKCGKLFYTYFSYNCYFYSMLLFFYFLITTKYNLKLNMQTMFSVFEYFSKIYLVFIQFLIGCCCYFVFSCLFLVAYF